MEEDNDSDYDGCNNAGEGEEDDEEEGYYDEEDDEEE